MIQNPWAPRNFFQTTALGIYINTVSKIPEKSQINVYRAKLIGEGALQQVLMLFGN